MLATDHTKLPTTTRCENDQVCPGTCLIRPRLSLILGVSLGGTRTQSLSRALMVYATTNIRSKSSSPGCSITWSRDQGEGRAIQTSNKRMSACLHPSNQLKRALEGWSHLRSCTANPPRSLPRLSMQRLNLSLSPLRPPPLATTASARALWAPTAADLWEPEWLRDWRLSMRVLVALQVWQWTECWMT